MLIALRFIRTPQDERWAEAYYDLSMVHTTGSYVDPYLDGSSGHSSIDC